MGFGVAVFSKSTRGATVALTWDFQESDPRAIVHLSSSSSIVSPRSGETDLRRRRRFPFFFLLTSGACALSTARGFIASLSSAFMCARPMRYMSFSNATASSSFSGLFNS